MTPKSQDESHENITEFSKTEDHAKMVSDNESFVASGSKEESTELETMYYSDIYAISTITPVHEDNFYATTEDDVAEADIKEDSIAEENSTKKYETEEYSTDEENTHEDITEEDITEEDVTEEDVTEEYQFVNQQQKEFNLIKEEVETIK